MEIDSKIVKRAAALSGIEIGDEKAQTMVKFFREMANHFRGLEECDTDKVDPFSDPDDSPCPFRSDEPVGWEDGKEALAAASLKEGPFFVVPPMGGMEDSHED